MTDDGGDRLFRFEYMVHFSSQDAVHPASL